jgi:hypothetical protein
MRAQRRYRYSRSDAEEYRATLMMLATIVDDPSPTPGAVPRDPACAVAAAAEHMITCDDHLLSLSCANCPPLWTDISHQPGTRDRAASQRGGLLNAWW